MHTAKDVVAWLQSLPKIKDVRPCRVTIGKKTFEGAYYVSIHEWQAGMDGVSRGEHKAGDEYTRRSIHLLGAVPKHPHTCFPFEGKDWYVSCYMDPKTAKTLTPEQKAMNPFGVTFQISPWEIEGQPESTIDQYERSPYHRKPMTVEWLDTE